MSNVDSLINSAVLVPIYRADTSKLRMVCIRRSDGGIHGGELSFPGGKQEPDDESLLFTALRETQEEIGLPFDHVQILAELPPVETESTGFRIFPFLCSIKPLDWIINKREVAEVINLDLESLADPTMFDKEIKQYNNWPAPRLIHFYRVGNYKLWGASFRILQPLLPRIMAKEWQV